MAVADKQVDSIIRELKGAVIRRKAGVDTRTIVVSLDAKRLGELREKLGKVWRVEKEETPSVRYEGNVQVEIMLTLALTTIAKRQGASSPLDYFRLR